MTSQVTLLEQSIVADDFTNVAEDRDFHTNVAAKERDFNNKDAEDDDLDKADAATIQRSDSERFFSEMNSCEMEASFTVCRDQGSNSTSPHLIGGI